MKNKILISAFACHPGMTSEAGIGWAFVLSAAELGRKQGFRVTAIMNGRSALASTSAARELGLSDWLEIVAIDVPRQLRILMRPKLTRIEYLVWTRLARVAARSSASDDTVLALHATFATEMYPTPITSVPSNVFRVWGPIGSAGDPNVYRVTPFSLGALKELLVQRLRDILVWMPMRQVGRGVDLVLGQNATVTDKFVKAGMTARTFPNVIVSDDWYATVEHGSSKDMNASNELHTGISILVVGHLVHRKRFELAIAALSAPELVTARLTVLGDPLPGEKNYLASFAKKFGVQDRVAFSGKVSREGVAAAMRSHDVLFHPSGREGASGVIGEATATGIPVVCFGRTGASSVLESAGTSGVIIGTAPNTSSSEIARALLEAALMERRTFLGWTRERFQSQISTLIDEADERLKN